MPIRTRDYVNVKNVAKLQIAGAILKRLRWPWTAATSGTAWRPCS